VCELIAQVVANCQVSGSVLGTCRICFSLFLLFSAKKGIPDSRFSESRFLQGRLFYFSSRIWTGWPVSQSRSGPCSRFFSCFIQIFYVFPCIVENRPLYRGNDITDENVSRRGSHERNGGVEETTISSAAIVSA
jgi:hypothetical protein